MKKTAITVFASCLAALFAAALLLPGGAAAQAGKDSPAQEVKKMDGKNIGKKFPNVTAESLAGNKESIPETCRGKVALVTVAFMRESQGQLDSWLNPFYKKFGESDKYTFFEIPMISSGYKFMKPIIDGGMRGGLPAFKHKHVVTMYGDVQQYLKALNLDPRYGHAFLLDREGVIRYQAQGFANEKLLQELFAAAENLAK